jgi:hypothetical protein
MLEFNLNITHFFFEKKIKIKIKMKRKKEEKEENEMIIEKIMYSSTFSNSVITKENGMFYVYIYDLRYSDPMKIKFGMSNIKKIWFDYRKSQSRFFYSNYSNQLFLREPSREFMIYDEGVEIKKIVTNDYRSYYLNYNNEIVMNKCPNLTKEKIKNIFAGSEFLIVCDLYNYIYHYDGFDSNKLEKIVYKNGEHLKIKNSLLCCGKDFFVAVNPKDEVVIWEHSGGFVVEQIRYKNDGVNGKIKDIKCCKSHILILCENGNVWTSGVIWIPRSNPGMFINGSKSFTKIEKIKFDKIYVTANYWIGVTENGDSYFAEEYWNIDRNAIDNSKSDRKDLRMDELTYFPSIRFKRKNNFKFKNNLFNFLKKNYKSDIVFSFY